MSSNLALANIFREIADLLDLQGEKFKPEAYRRAARSIESLAEDIRKVADRGELDSIPGVGEAIAEKTREYLKTGTIPYFERLRKELPPGLVEIMHLPGLGPKTARRFWVELGIEGPAELEEAIAAGRLDSVKGFGPKKIEIIRTSLKGRGTVAGRTPIAVAFRIASSIVDSLRKGSPTDRVEVAGSLRRRRETVGDLDILATSRDPERVFDAFSALAGIRSVTLRGSTKETVIWEGNLQIDLRVVEPDAFGAALQYFTGSKDHNVHLRSIARDLGLKVNEYGVFRGEERVAGTTEEDVYGALHLPWIPPEIRENHGEIEAAARHALPALVQDSDVRGVLHVHLLAEATEARVTALRRAAHTRGLEYVGVVVSSDPTDPPEASMPRGWRDLMDPDRRKAGPDLAQLVLGAELELGAEASAPAPNPEWDFWIVRPDAQVAAQPDRLASTVLEKHRPAFLAHLSGPEGHSGLPADRQSAWVKIAADLGVALDLNPAEGIDSAGAGKARESSVKLHLGPAQTPEDPLDGLSLAVGLARRAWVPATGVINSGPAYLAPGKGRGRATGGRR